MTGHGECAVARAVSGVRPKLRAALPAGAPGAGLGTKLNVADTLLAVEDITLLHDRERLLANGVPCHTESSALLRETLAARGSPDCTPFANTGRCRARGTMQGGPLAGVQSRV